MSRLLSAGVPVVCQLGFAKTVLAPPPPDPVESFHTLSATLPMSLCD
jgi:hypothetical protein